MMLSISGERGVGKTLHLAERVYLRRMEGYFTVTNFSHTHSNLDCSGMSPEEFLDVVLDIIEFKENGYEPFNLHPSFRHTGVYIAIDEATIYFSPEMQSTLSRKDKDKYSRLLNLLAQARKYDVEIDYVVQDPAKVGKDFRRYTEHYMRLRWFFKIKRLKHIPHPTLPIDRREHRHLIDVIWQEIHELDPENPKFNYATIKDERGVWQYSRNNTLLEKKLKLTGRYKRHIFKMYNSYQSVAVKRKEYKKDTSPLRNFRLVDGEFGRESFPTIKRLLRLVGIPVRYKDEYLPTKVGFEQIMLPSKSGREGQAIISEVQRQPEVIMQAKELREHIRKSYKESS